MLLKQFSIDINKYIFIYFDQKFDETNKFEHFNNKKYICKFFNF